jgi:ATP-dependent RNA helicase RhlE
MNETSKRRELVRMLRKVQGSVIVFTKTKDDASYLWQAIHSAGIEDSTYISSNKQQQHREEALNGFKEGKYRVLVATDVAARGIHVDAVSMVINFDLPMEPEDYVHRVGRTGRQGEKGRAISFVTPRDEREVEAIERFLKKRIPEKWVQDFRSEEPRRNPRPERGKKRR